MIATGTGRETEVAYGQIISSYRKVLTEIPSKLPQTIFAARR
jgi:hypothetical protein